MSPYDSWKLRSPEDEAERDYEEEEYDPEAEYDQDIGGEG